MVSMRRNLILLIMVTLAIACGTLAVMWPQWRAELGAQGYYGYFRPGRTGQIEVEPAGREQLAAGSNSDYKQTVGRWQWALGSKKANTREQAIGS